jgi:hypothetical protein
MECHSRFVDRERVQLPPALRLLALDICLVSSCYQLVLARMESLKKHHRQHFVVMNVESAQIRKSVVWVDQHCLPTDGKMN